MAKKTTKKATKKTTNVPTKTKKSAAQAKPALPDTIQFEIEIKELFSYDKKWLEAELKKAVDSQMNGAKYKDNVYITVSVYVPMPGGVASMNKDYTKHFENGNITPKFEPIGSILKDTNAFLVAYAVDGKYRSMSKTSSRYHSGKDTLLEVSVASGLIIN
jgi:hypothetical protein